MVITFKSGYQLEATSVNASAITASAKSYTEVDAIAQGIDGSIPTDNIFKEATYAGITTYPNDGNVAVVINFSYPTEDEKRDEEVVNLEMAVAELYELIMGGDF